MDRFDGTTSSQHTGMHYEGPMGRSYSEIARILAEREREPISPAEVEQICRAAERKLAQAIRADPVLDQWLVTAQRAPTGRPSIRVRGARSHNSREEYNA